MPDAWKLDNDDMPTLPKPYDMESVRSMGNPDRPRGRPQKKGELTTTAQCKLDGLSMRFIDELIAARTHLEYKTRSDFFRDAIYGLIYHVQTNAKLSPLCMRLYGQVKADYYEWASLQGTRLLDTYRSTVQTFTQTRNFSGLHNLLDEMTNMRANFDDGLLGASHIEQLDKLIHDVSWTLERNLPDNRI